MNCCSRALMKNTKYNRRNLDISWRVFPHKLDVATVTEWKVIRLINWKSLRNFHSLPSQCCLLHSVRIILLCKYQWKILNEERWIEGGTILPFLYHNVEHSLFIPNAYFFLLSNSCHLPSSNSLVFHAMPGLNPF